MQSAAVSYSIKEKVQEQFVGCPKDQAHRKVSLSLPSPDVIFQTVLLLFLAAPHTHKPRRRRARRFSLINAIAYRLFAACEIGL